MLKKISILLFTIILPLALAQTYAKYFDFAGGWLEQNRNYFKIGFLLTSIFGNIWLIVVSKKEKQYIWLVFSILLLIALLIYLYMGIAIINMSYGF
jgi:predicted Na+-dependent transporter